MRHEWNRSRVRLSLAMAAVSLTVVSLAGQVNDTPRAARTPWGDPDLQGVWNFSTVTPLERPTELAGKAVLTEAEAAEYAARQRQRNNRDINVRKGDVGDYNDAWYDRGTSVVETRRTSLVVDPPDGRIPPPTPGAQRKAEMIKQARRGVGGDEPTSGGWVEDLGFGGLRVRCISATNTLPFVPRAYNNNAQIVQAPGYVVLVSEMIHTARIVPLDGRPHSTVRGWEGSSRGRWEDKTLVVETVNFRPESTMFSNNLNLVSSPDLRLIERFTRVDADRLLYTVTIDDPATWTKPFTYELPMRKSSPEMIYEYACHEGNMGIVNILAGARARERTAANKQ